MIAVIADDFTGAAEIGGIGLKKGLNVLIETTVNEPENVDILVIATDSRSLPKEQAKREIEKITLQLMKLAPSFIYKKLDSVLRGNVYDELKIQMLVSGKSRAIIVAGNPHLKRTIDNGIYYINQVPLSETSFANDPEFPSTSSSVIKIIDSPDNDVFPLNVTDILPENGIIIGNVRNKDEMQKWSENPDNNTIYAGGAGFFDVILEKHFHSKPIKNEQKYLAGTTSLFIFGSTFPKKEEMLNKFGEARIPVMNMPAEIYQHKDSSPGRLKKWAEEIAIRLENDKKIVIAINHKPGKEKSLPERTRQVVGKLMKEITGLIKIDNLLIEGGATTSVILENLNITKLLPIKEVEAGVIQMKTPDFPEMNIITKPGSYPWPDCLILSTEERGNEFSPIIQLNNGIK